MAWNYRVIEHNDFVYGEKYTWLAIHETYYDYQGNPISISEEPDYAYGDNIEDLKESFDMMKVAFEKPIIKFINGKFKD